jgi:hypothetical protein
MRIDSAKIIELSHLTPMSLVSYGQEIENNRGISTGRIFGDLLRKGRLFNPEAPCWGFSRTTTKSQAFVVNALANLFPVMISLCKLPFTSMPYAFGQPLVSCSLC